MYFVVEYQGRRKTVKAQARTTLSEVNRLAFGFEEGGDQRAKDVRIIGATKRADVAAGMMCQVWPVRQQTVKCVQCKNADAHWDSLYCSESCKQAFLSFQEVR